MSGITPKKLSDSIYAYTKALTDKAKWVGINDPKALDRLMQHAIPDNLKDSDVLQHLTNLIRESIDTTNEARRLSAERVSKLIPDAASLKKVDDAVQAILPNVQKLTPEQAKKITRG